MTLSRYLKYILRRNKRGVEINGQWFEYNRITYVKTIYGKRELFGRGMVSLLEAAIRDTYKGKDYKVGDALQDFFNLIAKPGHHVIYTEQSIDDHKRLLEYAAKIMFFLIKDKKALVSLGITSYKHVLTAHINKGIYIKSMNLVIKDIAMYYRELRLKKEREDEK